MKSKPPSPARLLVVDDQEPNLRIIGGMLGDFGYEITLASTGDEALARLDRGPVDLILLDLMMPDRDGFEICQLVRQQPRWQDIPVIFLSAADDKDLIVRALDAGGVDYITKPFNQAELISRVRTQLALKTARDQLKQLAEDKDELLGILAHDLKNHLGGMAITLQVLQDRASRHGDSRLERAAANIRNSTVQMRAFVQEFLANSAADRGWTLDIKPVALNQAAVAAVQHHAEAARCKGVALEHEGGSDTAVAADRKALDQVLDNLISNALKFSPAGSTVRVSVQQTDRGGVLCVRDEGPGFTEDDKARMFRRYGRLSARPTAGEPSTGLGLSIVKKLVDAMGGAPRVRERGRAGRHLPRQSARAQWASSDPQPMNFLVVDDSSVFREAVCLLIEEDGHDAEGAATAELALERLQEDKIRRGAAGPPSGPRKRPGAAALDPEAPPEPAGGDGFRPGHGQVGRAGDAPRGDGLPGEALHPRAVPHGHRADPALRRARPQDRKPGGPGPGKPGAAARPDHRFRDAVDARGRWI